MPTALARRPIAMYTYIVVERTQIYLTRQEASVLDELAATKGVTRSHLIREAIDATFLAPRISQRDRLLAVLDELGAPWAERTDLDEGEAYVERMRRQSGDETTGVPVPGARRVRRGLGRGE